jgi:phosphotransferase system HPr (HPr) family protein
MWSRCATRQIRVSRPAGLHARPSLAIATAVRQFDAKVTIHSGGRTADASSILELLALGAAQGDALQLRAKGPEAEEALEALVRLFADDFGLADEPEG